MIVVSTGQSTVEQILDGYARSFVLSFSGVATAITAHLRSPTSTATGVQKQLQGAPAVGLFFFGHGLGPPDAGFLADDGKPAIDQNNMTLLSGRTIAATCCFGDQVGAHASAHQFSIFGYAGGLHVPLHRQHVQDTEIAALAAPKAIANGASPQNAVRIAQKEFRRLAYSLYNRNLPGDRPFALLAGINATIAGAW